METQEQRNNNILSNNRIGNHNAFIAIVPLVTMFGGLFVLVMGIALLVFFVVNRAGFLAFMPGVFTWGVRLVGIAAVCVLAGFVIKHIIGGIIQYVIGGFIKHVIEPLRKERVIFANDNFAAYTGNVNIAHHDNARYSYNIKQQQIEAPAQPLALPAPAAPVPSARQLIENGTVQAVIQRGEIIVGFLEDGTMKTLAYDLLYSTDLGGVGGSGKTRTAFWICVQEMFAGTKLIVVDPHLYVRRRGESQGLGHLLKPFKFAHLFEPCDDDPEQVMARARWMLAENERRKRPGVDLDTLPQIMFVIDEFNTVIENPEIKEELGNIIAKVQREGRKLGLFFLLLGHRWSQQDIGNIKIRTNAATVMAHYYNDEGQASKLIGEGKGKLCLELKPASYWLRGLMTGDLVKVRTPAISEQDSPLILNALGQPVTVVESTIEELRPNPAKQGGDTYRQTDELGDAPGDRYSQPGKPMEIPCGITLTQAQKEKMLMVLEMDTRQASQNQIIETVWQVNPKDRAGQAAAEELRLIRAYLAEQTRRALAS